MENISFCFEITSALGDVFAIFCQLVTILPPCPTRRRCSSRRSLWHAWPALVHCCHASSTPDFYEQQKDTTTNTSLHWYVKAWVCIHHRLTRPCQIRQNPHDLCPIAAAGLKARAAARSSRQQPHPSAIHPLTWLPGAYHYYPSSPKTSFPPLFFFHHLHRPRLLPLLLLVCLFSTPWGRLSLTVLPFFFPCLHVICDRCLPCRG